VPGTLYLDTSAVLRAVLEGGTTPEMERAIGAADTLITSRLSLVEAERAFIRLRASGAVPEERLADAGREVGGSGGTTGGRRTGGRRPMGSLRNLGALPAGV
jgi:hypothetical protein